MDPMHAYLCGAVLGELRNRGLHAIAENDDEGNYTDVINVLPEAGSFLSDLAVEVRLRVLPVEEPS